MNQEYLYNSPSLPKQIIIDNTTIGGKKPVIIAGPCTFGSYDEIAEIAEELKKIGIEFLRAGTFKPRTNPYSFQGLRDEGMEILFKIKQQYKLKIVVELATIEQVRKYGNMIDIVQIGMRNMYNYELLKECGKLKKPVMLKRNVAASYNDWLLAAEYILKEGNHNVILCERGIKNYNSNETRNVLDLQAIPYIKKHSNLPIIIDPSHASGHSYIVEPMSKAALVAGADGLIIETHIRPQDSLCDSQQTINIDTLKKIIKFKEENFK